MPISPSTGSLTAARLVEADAYVFLTPDFAYEQSPTSPIGGGGGFSTTARIAPLSGGGYVSVWSSSGNGHFVQVFDAAGQAASTIRASGPTWGPAGIASVAALADGGFVVAMRLTDGKFHAQRYDAQGVSLGDTVINTTAGSEDQVTGLTGGGFVVAWVADGDVFARRYDAAGVALGAEMLVNTATAGVQNKPSLTGLADGGFVVSWSSETDVRSQRYDAQGGAIGSEAVVATTAAGAQAGAEVAALAGGGYVIAWLSEDGANKEVHFQRYDGAGAKVGGELRADTFTGGKETPTVEALPDGGFVVAWTSVDQNPSTTNSIDDPAGVYRDVYGRRFDAGGAALGPEVRLNPYTGLDQLDPSVAALANGDIVTAWLHFSHHSSDSQVSTLSPVSVEALTAGNDTLAASPNARLVAGLGQHLGGADSLVGGAAIDRIQLIAPGVLDLTAPAAFSGFEVVAGSEGDDRFIVSGARLADVTHLFGRDGDDILQMGAAGTLDLRGVTLDSVERVQGSDGDDHIILKIVNYANPWTPAGLAGVEGLNAIDGGGGHDVVELTHSVYAPILNHWDWSGVEVIRGSAEDDVFNLWDSPNHALTVTQLLAQTMIEGGDGNDTLRFNNAGGGVTLALTAASVENLEGSHYADHFSGNDVANVLLGGFGDDWLYGGLGDDRLNGGSNDDELLGGAGDDVLDGSDGDDILYGMSGDDILYDGDETSQYDNDETVSGDFLFGGPGNDTYHVTTLSTGKLDIIYEGGDNPDVAAGPNDIDVIHSYGDFWRDYYSVGEILHIERATGAQIIGGTNNQTIYGGAGGDLILAYGGSNRIDGGAGTDVIGLGLYDLAESFDGVNTVVMKPGSGMDYIFAFESGVDKIDLTAFDFPINGQQVLDQVVNVDQAGTDNDWCYLYLTDAGGVQNFVVFVGLLSTQLQAADFIT